MSKKHSEGFSVVNGVGEVLRVYSAEHEAGDGRSAEDLATEYAAKLTARTGESHSVLDAEGKKLGNAKPVAAADGAPAAKPKRRK